MTNNELLMWFVGLFEGEGSFHFVSGKANSLDVAMTDEDIILKLQENFGGSVYPIKKREAHWKDCWKWSLYGDDAVALAKKMRPLLGLRRSVRCEEFISEWESRREAYKQKKADATRKKNMVLEMWSAGKTAKEISSETGYVPHSVYNIIHQNKKRAT